MSRENWNRTSASSATPMSSWVGAEKITSAGSRCSGRRISRRVVVGAGRSTAASRSASMVVRWSPPLTTPVT